MAGERIYPETVATEFPQPPVSFTDAEGRPIEVRAYEQHGPPDATLATDEESDPPPEDAAFEPLVAMYADFDPADRAQGVPPVGEVRIRDWLDTLLAREGFDVLAWHEDSVAGHATLVPDSGETYELAIFVHQDYQGAGIGTRLIEALLGHGQAHGVEYVWLTVERWNRPAVALYEKVGFETAAAESFEMEMSIRLN
ncbi:GNAT family N-acetyltransferase [Halobacterium wangiae]|uniref:GNAT family N-acetyltransferase n=1 Tax=Halobacterium wangiae TaxID=2902623 RepID=UPI001E654065|nr:GNAT family N-acetyltransferase [Halobacterium wangiae]